MRLLYLTGTIAVLLAGCASGKVGEAPERTAAGGHSSHGAHGAHAAPAGGPTHAHSTAESIPAAYHGIFDGSLEACGRPSVERLTVSARELRFHESVGTVRSVAYGGGFGAIAVEADYEGEGERRRALRILALSENGTKLTVKGDGAGLERVRCPGSAH